VSITRLADFVIKKAIRAESIQGFEEMEVFGVSNKLGITVTDHKKSKDLAKYLLIEEGDFAYNPYRINVGSIGLVPAGKRGLVSPAYVVFKTTDELIPELLFDFLKSQEGLRQIGKYARGTVRKALRFEDLAQIELPVPPKDKQQEILAKRKSIEVEVESVKTELTHQQTLLKKLRQQILQEAIEGKLTADWRAQNPDVEPASELLKRIAAEKAQLVKDKKIKAQKPLPPVMDEEKPFEIPPMWEWSRLGDVCIKITDGFHNTPPKVAAGYPYIGATHVKSEKIDWSACHYVSEEFHKELHSKAYPKRGEILLVNIGAGCGTPAIIDVDFEFSFKNTAILKFNQDLLLNIYVFNYFVLHRDAIYKDLTKGGLQPFLSLKILNHIIIPIPSSEEQHAIVTKLEKLLALCDQLEAQITQNQSHAEQLMQAVLKEAFNHNAAVGTTSPMPEAAHA